VGGRASGGEVVGGLAALFVSEPGADRGPRAGSPRGVVDATGSNYPTLDWTTRVLFTLRG